MSYGVYKVLHLLGVMLLFLSLGGLALRSLLAPGASTSSAEGEGQAPKPPHRGLLFGLHGVAMLLLLVAGFGALAKLGMSGGIPAWVHPKLLIWLALGAAPALLERKPAAAKALLFVFPLLGLAAAWLAVQKPWVG